MKIGVKFAYFRSRPETDWYPHYIHNQENLIRFGGLFPPIHVNADYRRTRMLGLTHVPYEGGCMMVRAKDNLYRMSDLKGKRIGITKSLNTLKNDWWRIQEHQGILAMLRMNGMTEKDIQLVDFPYPDDWYDDPDMLVPMVNPTHWQLSRDHKHDLAFRPLETALLEGKVDAMIGRVLEDGWEINDAINEGKKIAEKPDEAVLFATKYVESYGQSGGLSKVPD